MEHLEPRVAKLEAGLEILTRNVNDLTGAVRDISHSLDVKLERLTVDVTKAQAPRKTDWSVIISFALLVMAIGSAVFWPLNQTGQSNLDAISKLQNELSNHERLTLHPVGQALVNNLAKADDQKAQELQKQLSDLDNRIQWELNLKNERTDARLSKLELWEKEMALRDNEELRKWRLNALGGTR